MRVSRALLAGVSAAALGGGLVISMAVAAPRSAPAGHTATGHVHLTARFLSAARAALVKDLRTPDIAQYPDGAPRAGTRTDSTAVGSFNWAGYVDTATKSGTFTKVSGSWKVPRVTSCTPEDRITGDWVGLDGASSANPTVEQAGTLSWCFEDKAVYASWYEMSPNGLMEVGKTVAPGDSISASVTRSGTSYTLKLTDATHTANSFTETATCALATCLDESAEWIAERPAFSTGLGPEAPFTPVKFTHASETADGKTSTISGYSGTNDNYTCIDSTDSYDLVTTSSLTGGNSFTNTWEDSF
jgi:hypothetical protein